MQFSFFLLYLLILCNTSGYLRSCSTIFQRFNLIASISVCFYFTVPSTSSFVFRSFQCILFIRLQHHISNTSSFFLLASFIIHITYPYVATLCTIILIHFFFYFSCWVFLDVILFLIYIYYFIYFF